MKPQKKETPEESIELAEKLLQNKETWAEGIIKLRPLANAGNPSACYELGYHYRWSEKIYHEAKKWFELGTQAGGSNCAEALGHMYYYGRGAELDYNLARKYYEIALTRGNKDVSSKLGELLASGLAGEADPERAFGLFQNSENRHGAWHLGCCYRDGIGAPVNLEKAREAFQKALELGDTDAQAAIDTLEEDAICGEIRKAVKWLEDLKTREKGEKTLKVLATKGNSQAAHCLGHFHRWTSCKIDEAIKWFFVGTQNGGKISPQKLGHIYAKGQLNTPVKSKAARELFALALHRGNFAAANDLGLMLLDGSGGPKNEEEAFKHFLLAACDGEYENKYSHWNIGRCYRDGMGVPIDKERAIEAFETAKKLGHHLAEQEIQKLKES